MNSHTFNQMTEEPDALFISIDWGTSRLRIYLVNAIKSQIIRQKTSNQGIKPLHRQWQESGEDRLTYYLGYLKSELNEWKLEMSQNLPCFISGMASSTIGIYSLPYADLPFQCNGEGLYMEKVKQAVLPNPIYLISGVRSQDDVMRGEETQLVGLHQENDHRDIIYLLPGTHSKHIYVENDRVTGFHTFLTGELFDIICQNSLLRESVRKSPYNSTVSEAFISGIKQSSNNRFLNDLFRIRTSDLFEERSKEENYYFLSGLVIGQELKHLKNHPADRIILGASGDLATLYQLAAEVFQVSTEVVQEEALDHAVVRGHRKFFELINNAPL